MKRDFLAEINGWKERHPLIVETIENFKKEKLNEYCIDKCNKSCCYSNHLYLSEEQVRLIFGISDGRKIDALNDNLENPLIIRQDDGTFSTKFKRGQSCPRHLDGLCDIYLHPLKPVYCNNYPFHYQTINGDDILKVEMLCSGQEYLLDPQINRNFNFSHLKEFAKNDGVLIRF